MKLYRIRNKQTGKFFCRWIAPWNPKWAGKIYWSDKGTFYSTIDTIAKHLKLLCSEWKSCDMRRKRLPDVIKFDKAKLENYEIVINDVSINGEKIIQAKDLVKK